MWVVYTAKLALCFHKWIFFSLFTNNLLLYIILGSQNFCYIHIFLSQSEQSLCYFIYLVIHVFFCIWFWYDFVVYDYYIVCFIYMVYYMAYCFDIFVVVVVLKVYWLVNLLNFIWLLYWLGLCSLWIREWIFTWLILWLFIGYLYSY